MSYTSQQLAHYADMFNLTKKFKSLRLPEGPKDLYQELNSKKLSDSFDKVKESKASHHSGSITDKELLMFRERAKVHKSFFAGSQNTPPPGSGPRGVYKTTTPTTCLRGPDKGINNILDGRATRHARRQGGIPGRKKDATQIAAARKRQGDGGNAERGKIDSKPGRD